MMKVSAFLNYLRVLPDYREQIVHVEHVPARAPEYSPLVTLLRPALAEALRKQGVTRFYAHQAEAINAVRAGEHVIVASGTASGKTLCYNVPVLQAVLEQPLCKALYLFPTKALAQDQLRALKDLSHGLLKEGQISTYDGDTPSSARGRIRRAASIILTNPDMLHASILPNHTLWGGFLRHLRYVVLDEAHAYRGIFGSHVAVVLRRLRRLCARYGAEPQFILGSATLANPGEHAQQLTGLPMTVIDVDGAPHGPREFVLWNPPISDRKSGARSSPNIEAAAILAELVQKKVRSLVFGRTRRVVELIALYARQALEKKHPELVRRISSYRAGYLPQERREIERQLFKGELWGVTATNALELGIDVGALDATVLVGYPGTIASTWQQAGRSGRGLKEALTILIAQDNPLDQYVIHHPEALFGRPHEHALTDPGNVYVLKAHLPCAASECPLEAGEEALFGKSFRECIAALQAEKVLEARQGRWYYPHADYPAQRVSLRSMSGENYVLVDETANYRVLEEIDAATAFIRIYPGAIYLHRGESYLVTRLDLTKRLACARPVESDYYTQVLEDGDVHIIRSLQARSEGDVDVFLGQVRVTQRVTGFVRKQQYTDEKLSEEPLDFPPSTFETEAVWFEIPPPIQKSLAQRGCDLAGALHAAEHACIGILPLFAMCDRTDIAGLSTPMHVDTGRPQIFVYDAHPGGVGIARKGFALIDAWWERAWQVIKDCPCEEGCPSCIQSPRCGSNNTPLDKLGAEILLKSLSQNVVLHNTTN